MPRLEAVIGCAIKDVAWGTLQRLVEERIPEDLTLDYKATAYRPTEDGRFELAKDVAAFANAIGGLIVVGIGETHHLPSGFSHQQPTDAVKRDVMS